MINENIHSNEPMVHEITQITDYYKVTFDHIQNLPQDINYLCDNMVIPTDPNTETDTSKDNENDIDMQKTLQQCFVPLISSVTYVFFNLSSCAYFQYYFSISVAEVCLNPKSLPNSRNIEQGD